MAKQPGTINLIDIFSEFKDLKNIDRQTFINVLEDSFRNVITKMYGSDANYDVIINPDKGDLEIYRNRLVMEDDDVLNPNTQIALSDALKINETDVLEIADGSTSISRSHIAQTMVKKGYFPTVADTFAQLLEKGKPAYVSHYRLEPEEIIDLIKNSGGTPVLAHPKLVKDDELVEELLKKGIEGIEAIYPRHTDEDTKRYLEMADKYHLLVTGGSDFHGIAGRLPKFLGEFTVPTLSRCRTDKSSAAPSSS